jgi:c-di-GMP-binding flagellar brake protein YcgR
MGSGSEKIQSFTVDLSGGGLLLAGPDTLQIGERIEFRLTVAQDAPPIKGVGTVVRIDSKGRRGVSFTEIAETDRRRLVRFIFDLQRSERRRGLREQDRYGS